MSVAVITMPAVMPVTVADVVAHSRLDADTIDSAYLDMLIAGATAQAEHETGRSLIERTLEWRAESFPTAGSIELPFGPLEAVTEVSYLDADGVRQTWFPSRYLVDADPIVATLTPAPGESWPATGSPVPGNVRVRYVAGYGALPADVPAAVRHWILVRVALGYEYREPVMQGSLAPVPYLDGLLDPYRVPRA